MLETTFNVKVLSNFGNLYTVSIPTSIEPEYSVEYEEGGMVFNTDDISADKCLEEKKQEFISDKENLKECAELIPLNSREKLIDFFEYTKSDDDYFYDLDNSHILHD